MLIKLEYYAENQRSLTEKYSLVYKGQVISASLAKSHLSGRDTFEENWPHLVRCHMRLLRESTAADSITGVSRT